jgi:hypothetical protein
MRKRPRSIAYANIPDTAGIAVRENARGDERSPLSAAGASSFAAEAEAASSP